MLTLTGAIFIAATMINPNDGMFGLTKEEFSQYRVMCIRSENNPKMLNCHGKLDPSYKCISVDQNHLVCKGEPFAPIKPMKKQREWSA